MCVHMTRVRHNTQARTRAHALHKNVNVSDEVPLVVLMVWLHKQRPLLTGMTTTTQRHNTAEARIAMHRRWGYFGFIFHPPADSALRTRHILFIRLPTLTTARNFTFEIEKHKWTEQEFLN